MNKYPIYVISKGRYERPLTCRALDKMGVDYRLVIEPQEEELYDSAGITGSISVLPFSNLGKGSIPARNWVWEHSKSKGHKRHWILDDNIEQFNRMNRNLQVRCNSSAIFRAAEDFVDRYKNVAIAGFEYDFFAKSRVKWNPFRLNTRIYSTLLIDNAINHRWRGKYNEDTDLSLRVLKDGFCTVLFLAFLQQKTQSMKMGGGNEEIYAETDQRLEFAKSLQVQHPDVVKITKKFGRWHHHVDYRDFKRNKLQRKPSKTPCRGVNNYGMVLRTNATDSGSSLRDSANPVVDGGAE
jgi:hypothetical protein